MKIEIPDEQIFAALDTLSNQFHTGLTRDFLASLQSEVDEWQKEEWEEDTVVGGPPMPELTLQQRLYNWQVCNFGEPVLRHLAWGVFEEVGELMHCGLKREQGIRGFDDGAHFREHAGDAIADAAIYCLQILSALGCDGYEFFEWKRDRPLDDVLSHCGLSAALLMHGGVDASGVGSMLRTLTAVAVTLEIDIASEVAKVAEKVMQRDWTK